jgi:DNA-binding PadR family transcriptional regulator
MAEVMTHEFLLGFIKIYILQFAEREPVYGKDIHDRLNEKGFNISYGTLYNTFHNFEKKGYLVQENQNVNGKIRKYYNITGDGKKALDEAKSRTSELLAILST